MREKIAPSLGPLIGGLLLVVSGAVGRSELKSYRLQDVLQSFGAISSGQLMAAIGLTILGYGAMTGYDTLGGLLLNPGAGLLSRKPEYSATLCVSAARFPVSGGADCDRSNPGF